MSIIPQQNTYAHVHAHTHTHTHTRNTKTPFIDKKANGQKIRQMARKIFSANVTKVQVLVKEYIQRGKNKPKALREKQAKVLE